MAKDKDVKKEPNKTAKKATKKDATGKRDLDAPPGREWWAKRGITE